MSYNIAVLGATGNVGRSILDALADSDVVSEDIYAVASSASLGKQVSCGDLVLDVHDVNEFDFSHIDLVIFAIRSNIVPEYIKLVKSHNPKAIIVDTSSHFRMDDDIPLIVPEINGEQLLQKEHSLISSPNCVVAALSLVMKPLHDIANIKRAIISTYQSVSGAGKREMEELYSQTKGIYVNDNKPPQYFDKRIAFNLIPTIGAIDKSGDCEEEIKISQEVKKIISPSIAITATCVRVPVFRGHCISLNIEFHQDVSLTQLKRCLSNSPGICLFNKDAYLTPIECVGDDEIFISRVRKDKSTKNAFNMWIVSDNLRKGAGLNAVQIAQKIINQV